MCFGGPLGGFFSKEAPRERRRLGLEHTPPINGQPTTINTPSLPPRLYTFEGAICCWDMPPATLGALARPGSGGAAGAGANGGAARALGGAGGLSGGSNSREQPLGGGGGGGGGGAWGQQVGLVSRDPLDANNLLLR